MLDKEEARKQIERQLPSIAAEPVGTNLSARLVYTRCRARLVLYAELRGIILVDGEGYVIQPRRGHPRGEKGLTTHAQRTPQLFTDAVHILHSTHYVGCGGDELVYAVPRAGGSQLPAYVSDGADPLYQELGEFWEGLHPMARWGGHFGDADHFSIEWQGVK